MEKRIEVVRMQNPQAFLFPEVQALFKRAFHGNALLRFEDCPEGFVAMVVDPLIGVFLGRENGRFKALGVVMLPANAMQGKPRVFSFYCSGSAALRNAMQKAGVDFMRGAGYTGFWAINTTGKSQGIYARLFKGMGEAKEIGTIVEFTLPEVPKE